MKNSFLTVLIISGLFACKSGDKQPETKAVAEELPSNEVQLTDEQFKNGDLAIGAVATKDMHTTTKVNGVIDVPPQNIVSVSMPMGGYLKKMNLLPGMQVAKGQVMATLEDPQYIQLQEDYLVTRSRLKFLEADYKRQKELNETKINSDKVFQQVRSEYESQQVMARSLAQKLQLININPATLTEQTISRQVNVYAPISGYVSKVNVNIGRYVNPSDILFDLMDPADLHLSLTVFEKDVINLAPDQKVICYTNANPEEKYTARIHLITRNVDDNRTAEVHCHFDKYDKRLLPGMYMNAIIELNSDNITAVPDDALVSWHEKSYVFVVKGKNTFVMTPVEPGPANDGFTAVKSGVSAGQQIVTKNAYALLMKMKNSGEE
ncbi:membrane fusion protein, cobalt-zinc-cadmium efflux system [Chitinophaga terrae (ex Kim and Jung 2007)]|jgi:cobalt-zinc-cadmium efflux system membrane fusion protein|uniref:Membrane fusion protein, cobalt-zinc-cadmium efflux system n=1 Tax=Chitinophaga terrae (ex Kim and Jung 2007) TaxID=408074 RepID=A0A1H3XDE9_9BACT|nr:efflux RND transporter periplasmic adaptor subunit [Chitinophaga terrae (ex Kim and Jung 2007)]MDQ0108874.1 cobalt-zinc-cadmium efflux system membrane fusion protein [Chitinophaga terrae (ex Kim and Jung 2007)]GEP89787.1 hemolysin D [Chitinophaga terrae (ex Kim and Jung 2007)]SDZ97426.1 membrane fusion protein, cobalt-zinc-cadmium efflux system [Chitinophaga terrae (ex Kim and Jung 2007)]